MTQIVGEEWKLKSITISYQEYGEFKGKYVGKIEFNNRTNEAFMFNLSPDDTQKYMNLISEKLVTSASHLGDKLLSSLNLLPAPKTFSIDHIPTPEPVESVKPVTGNEFGDDLPF